MGLTSVFRTDRGTFVAVAFVNAGVQVTMFDRITSDPEILGGKPIVRGTRISVAMILEWFASGETRDQILTAYPHLHGEDIEQALGYAASMSENEVLVPGRVAV